jgi:RimJ/RimL family protein N-acetyltransferase
MARIDRLSSAISRYGLGGLASTVARKARERVAFSESHVWYELDLTAPRETRVLEEGLILRPGREADLALLEQLDTVWPERARRRLQDGNDWWLVLDQGAPLFSCWIFRERAPVLAAPQGELALPAGCVCLEDSVTSAAARGRGIAPAAWSAIAASLAQEGQRRMITKVTVENVPSRRAVTKAGFVEVAIMHFRRRGIRSGTSVDVLEQDGGAFFAAALA